MEKYEVAVVEGDGIGPEICRAAVDVLKTVFGSHPKLEFDTRRRVDLFLNATTDKPLQGGLRV